MRSVPGRPNGIRNTHPRARYEVGRNVECALGTDLQATFDGPAQVGVYAQFRGAVWSRI